MKFVALDRSNNFTGENFKMYYLKIAFDSISYKPVNSIVKLKGNKTGGWSKKDFNYLYKNSNIENNAKVFIGQKRGTVNKLYLQPYRTNPCTAIVQELYAEWHWVDSTSTKYIIKLKGEEIKEQTVIDQFSSFYLDSYSFYNTNPGE
ncbi:MAG: hypothetical protein ACJA1Z_003112 [Patiriisocius sp.]|jgi:hypothetical protein